MSREAHIPLVLWISAAILVHMAGGGGAVEVADVLEERAQFRAMVHAVRDSLRPDTTFEILVAGTEPTPPQAPRPPPSDAPESEDDKAKSRKEPEAVDFLVKPKKQKPRPLTVVKPQPTPKVVSKPPPPPPAPPPVPSVIAKVEPVKPVPPTVPPPADKRLAVRQNVQKDQEDNAAAQRIADDANRTNEETVARLRSHDHDASEPTPGGGGVAADDPGNSDHSKVAQSEEKQGNPDHAPGEARPSSTSIEHHNPASGSQPAPAVVSRAPAPSLPGSRAGGGGASSAPPPSEASPGSPGGSGPASPEVTGGDQGGWRIDPANPGGDGKSRVAGRKREATPYQSPVSVGSTGFGAPGIPGGPNLNLTMGGLEAAVGIDQLKRERAADGEARRTAHRGSSDPTNKFQRMRAAIENYEPSVKLGNQTSLNAARVPFASYLNAIHNRLHPIFAEEFLAALENLPPSHTLNQNLVTHVEIVLSKDEGRIVRLGVTRASGSTAFDAVALSSVNRSSPFGKAPDIIVSPDGNVYIHWEFHRDPFDACTTRNARPFLLKSAPSVTPTPGSVKKPSLSPSSDDRRGGPAPLLPLR